MRWPLRRRSSRTSGAAGERGHPHPRPGQALRAAPRGGRDRPGRAGGRRLRLPRRQRLRQDDHGPHAARSGATDEWGDRPAGGADAARRTTGAAPGRGADRGPGALRAPLGPGESLAAGRGRPQGFLADAVPARGRGTRPGRPRGSGPPAGQGVLARYAPAAGSRGRADASSGAAGARRADQRPGPPGHLGDPRAAARPPPRGDDGLPLQPSARRGRAAVHTGRGPGPRPAGAAGPAGDHDRADRVDGGPHLRPRPGPGHPRRPGHVDRRRAGDRAGRRPGRGQRPAGRGRRPCPRPVAGAPDTRGRGPGRCRRQPRPGGRPPMIVVELRKMFRRPRTWATIAVLNALPVLVAVLLVLTDLAPRPGEGPPFLSAVLSNSALCPLAALAIVLPLFLPIAVAVVAGDSIAGEAQAGTLRYLLARPAGRTRLLVAKLVSVLVFVLVTVVVVAGVGYLIGTTFFGVAPVTAPGSSGTSLSGTSLTAAELGQRTVLAVGYVGVSMLGVAAFALFFSTLTDSPLGATMGALAVLVASSLLFPLDAASPIAPYLPTRYWLAFSVFFRHQFPWRDVLRGLALQGVYVGVLLAAAWANFTTKDVTS